MKKIPFGTIFQVIQIIAIGYLVFKILQPTSASEKLDRIEQNQIELKKQGEAIMANDAARYAKYDSANQAQIKRIDSLTTSIGSDLGQLRKINKSINEWTKIFKENRVELPDPDK